MPSNLPVIQALAALLRCLESMLLADDPPAASRPRCLELIQAALELTGDLERGEFAAVR
jgi:hypothetical protein